MIFYGLDKKSILENSELVDGYYKYKLGNKVEVTSLKKKHVNEILTKNLSSQVKEDKLMVRYYPTNEIFFKKDFLDSTNDKNFSSFCVQKESYSTFIGNTKDFTITSGILAFSGVLSLNNMIEKDRVILCNSQMEDYVRKKVKILACGLRSDKLLALYYIPSERGLALSCDTGNMSISAKSLIIKNYSNWGTYTLDDWFDGVKVREIE